MNKLVLPKATLDELMRMSEEMFSGVLIDDMDGFIQRRLDLAKTMREDLGAMDYWVYLDLVDVVFRMAQGDKHEALYKVLDVLGWEVE